MFIQISGILFPKNQKRKLIKIAHKFYHNLCDLFLEVIKVKTVSQKKLLKRISFKNIEIVDRLYNEGRSVMAILGHIGNWEWVGVNGIFL